MPCIQKGVAGSGAQISGTFDILYVDQPGSVQGAFVMPAPWSLNTDTLAKFLNTAAPSGPTRARKVGIKATKLARFGSRGLGDSGTIDITNPPGPGGVSPETILRDCGAAADYKGYHMVGPAALLHTSVQTHASGPGGAQPARAARSVLRLGGGVSAAGQACTAPHRSRRAM